VSTTRSAPSHAPLHHAVELLERATSYTRVQLQVISPAMLSRPTPCTQWTLADLLDHMVGSLDGLAEATDLSQFHRDGVDHGGVAHDEVGRDRVGGATDAVPTTTSVGAVDRLRDRACRLLADWSAVARDDDVTIGDKALSSSVLACAGALEVAVHGWDVSQATGSCEPVPAVLARDLLVWADVLVSDADRPTRFDHPVDGPSVGPSSRLLRMLGREP
jgi:uncharacterized protein (TIGR03086 family)